MDLNGLGSGKTSVVHFGGYDMERVKKAGNILDPNFKGD